jgi:hypothetical protein
LIIVGGPEARITIAKGVLEALVQHSGTYTQKRLYGLRKACMPHRLPSTSTELLAGDGIDFGHSEWNLSPNFGDAVSQVMAQTPRSSSLVENLNS